MKLAKKLCLFLPALALILAASLPAAAAYPEKPLNMIIVFTAGGSSDVQARIMQKYWNKYVQQPWVFVYKPGAGGILGTTELARSPGDGYVVGGLNVPHIVLQSLAQNAQFNADSFKFIAQVVNDPQCVAVLKTSPFKTFQDVLAAAEAKPGKLKAGLVGPLSGHHLMFLDFNKKFPGIKISRVFYKGAADQNAALLGGEVDLIFGNINDVMRSIDEFRVLSVAAEKRNDFLPDVPTFREQGYDVVSDIRRTFAAPRDIPAEKLAWLRDVFKRICEDPGYLADMKKAGQPAEYMDGEALAAYVRSLEAREKKTLEEAGLIPGKQP